MVMEIMQLLGPFVDDIAEGDRITEVRQSYRELLELDGVVFPDKTVEHTLKQHTAWAAQSRGSIELNDDGSQVDQSGFDQNNVSEILRANQLAIQNADKLTAIVDLSLYSMAGSLAINYYAEHAGPESPDVRTAETYMDYYKQFVETGLLVEVWSNPWKDLVYSGFYGQSLSTTVDAATVIHCQNLLFEKRFKRLQEKHFQTVTITRFNILNALDQVMPYDGPESPVAKAASIGLFYRQAPDACLDVIQAYEQSNVLPASIDWATEIPRAVWCSTQHIV